MEFNKLLCQTADKIDGLRREFTEKYFYMGGLEDDIQQMVSSESKHIARRSSRCDIHYIH